MTAENCLRSKSCYTSAPKAEKACSPGKRARSLGWIRTLVSGLSIVLYVACSLAWLSLLAVSLPCIWFSIFGFLL